MFAMFFIELSISLLYIQIFGVQRALRYWFWGADAMDGIE